jgi:hypothetical protein
MYDHPFTIVSCLPHRFHYFQRLITHEMKFLRLIALVCCSTLAQPVLAQLDTIRISDKDLLTSNLKEGLHQYLVYFEDPKKGRITGSFIWNRQVNFKTHGGKEVIEIVQHWFGSDSTTNRYVYSISDRKTFAPVYHYTKSSRGVEAFDFVPEKITGSDSVSGNSKKDLEVTLQTPTLNWEDDLEIFSTLPIKKVGQRFIMNFYHPGGRLVPGYYEYAVIGSEKIKSIEDRSIDCWQLKINYAQFGGWAIFWIDKKSHEVLKMQEFFGTGYRYKVRLVTPVLLTKN